MSTGQRRLDRRLRWWTVVVGVLATIAYAGNLASDETDKDLAFQWETSIATLGQFAVLFGIVMLLTWGLDRREILALRRPTSWWQAAGISILVIIGVFIVSGVVAGGCRSDRATETPLDAQPVISSATTLHLARVCHRRTIDSDRIRSDQ